MAPEQWEGHAVPTTDQYSLAIMAYELLAGRPPFHGGLTQMMYQHLSVRPQPLSAYNPHIPLWKVAAAKIILTSLLLYPAIHIRPYPQRRQLPPLLRMLQPVRIRQIHIPSRVRWYSMILWSITARAMRGWRVQTNWAPPASSLREHIKPLNPMLAFSTP